MIRVLVVDDSSFLRKALRRVLESDPEIRVVGEAGRGDEALALLDELDPDLVTLDVEMPGLDGLSTLARIVARRPRLPVVMLSARTRDGAETTLRALELGAVDFIDKTTIGAMDLDTLGNRVLEKVRVWSASGGRGARVQEPATVVPPALELDWDRFDLMVIGASTGGPPAIHSLLAAIPASFPLPIAIVQHMPVGFTAPFAERLDRASRLEVKEAATGQRLEPGRAVVARAGLHLAVEKDMTIELRERPADAKHRPSVDVLFSSAAAVLGARTLGLLLTGMGDDGAAGMLAIREAGGMTLAESRESCVVYGMPGAAERIGAVDRSLPLTSLVELVRRRSAGD